MRTIIILLVVIIAGCSESPTRAGDLGERTHGGLMFFRVRPDVQTEPRLYHVHRIWETPREVEPALMGGTFSSTSLDGEWFTWFDEGVVWLRRLRNQNERRITPEDAVDGAPKLTVGASRVVLMRTRTDPSGASFPRMTFVNAATLEETQLAPDDGRGLTPAMSPDGSEIVWRSSTRSMGLELLTADGDLARVLVPGAWGLRDTHMPAWSPDGLRIAYVADYWESPDDDVVVINRFGDVLHRLTVQGAAIQPAWSPDGKQIAVCIRQTNVAIPQDRIVVWDLERNTQQPIANYGASDCYPAWGR